MDVIAPAYGVHPRDLKAIEKYIISIGLTPRIPKEMMGEDALCSNTEAKRLELLKAALYAPDSKAVWAVKGGYGTTPLIQPLLKHDAPLVTKLVIGFSDITALHLLVNQHWGWPSLHASVLWQIVKERVAASSLMRLQDVLFGKADQQEYQVEMLNAAHADIESTITGGN